MMDAVCTSETSAFFNELHGVIFYNALIFSLAAVRT
jgi:hypothetical protein